MHACKKRSQQGQQLNNLDERFDKLDHTFHYTLQGQQGEQQKQPQKQQQQTTTLITDSINKNNNNWIHKENKIVDRDNIGNKENRNHKGNS